RHVHGCRGVWRDRDVEMKCVVLDPPGAFDCAVHGAELPSSVLKPAAPCPELSRTGNGANDDVLVTRRFRIDIDPRDPRIQPLAHRAVSVMVIAVHARVIETLLRRPAIPALPYRRRAVRHREKP